MVFTLLFLPVLATTPPGALLPASQEAGQIPEDGGLPLASGAAGLTDTLGHREEGQFRWGGLNGWPLSKSACLLVWWMYLTCCCHRHQGFRKRLKTRLSSAKSFNLR